MIRQTWNPEPNTSEIGIRMELGADRMSVRMMLRGAFLQLGIGLAVIFQLRSWQLTRRRASCSAQSSTIL